MRTIAIVSSIILLSSCRNEPHRQFMDEIEQQVVLPKGAGPMDAYSRYYAEERSGRIDALYVIESDLYREEAQKLCATKKEAAYPCNGTGKSQLASKGGRMWLNDVRDLPVPNGGGCQAIEFSYEPTTRKLATPECNGSN